MIVVVVVAFDEVVTVNVDEVVDVMTLGKELRGRRTTDPGRWLETIQLLEVGGLLMVQLENQKGSVFEGRWAQADELPGE